jgi:hypothetical protein
MSHGGASSLALRRPARQRFTGDFGPLASRLRPFPSSCSIERSGLLSESTARNSVIEVQLAIPPVVVKAIGDVVVPMATSALGSASKISRASSLPRA